MTRSNIWIAILAVTAAVVLAGCERKSQSPPAVALAAPTDQWLGQWNGPEGSYLALTKSGDKFVVKINSLDGTDVYEGVAAPDHIEFQRRGRTESIHAGTSQDTGMKWLLDKKHCLIIKTGEGFCRD